jgi:hypothetical protein
MDTQILKEIKGLKALFAQLIGTSELSSKEKFSKEALDKAAKEFQKLSIERGEWVHDGDINKYIKNAPYRAGNFIRQEFGFTNYFIRGKSYYYNKKDLIELSKQLKDRNVNLGRYMEYCDDKAKFKKYLESAAENNKGKRNKKGFHLPDGLKDITTSPPTPPPVEVIKDDISRLKEEFFQK